MIQVNIAKKYLSGLMEDGIFHLPLRNQCSYQIPYWTDVYSNIPVSYI